jgi:hypothetical protein
VRGGALAQVAALSASIEGRAALTKTDVVRVLVRLIGDVNQTYVKDSMSALINLAEVSLFATQMVERNVVSRVLDLLLDASDSKLMPLYIMLLSNVTRVEAGARKLLNLDDDVSLKGYYVSKLLPLFLSEPTPSSKTQLPMQSELAAAGTDRNAWLGGILVNATTLTEGREIFTDKENRFLKLFIPQFSSKNPLRRRASLGVVRNCLFDHKDHEWVLKDEEMDLLTEILSLIRGPSPFENPSDTEGMNERLKNVAETKKVEEDVECKKLIIDILTLFTASRFGRDYLKDHKAYPIVREFDRSENNETISAKLYDLVHVLLLDDPEDEQAQADAQADIENARLAQEGQQQDASASGQASSSSSPQAIPIPPSKDIDEYGEEIEEL